MCGSGGIICAINEFRLTAVSRRFPEQIRTRDDDERGANYCATFARPSTEIASIFHPNDKRDVNLLGDVKTFIYLESGLSLNGTPCGASGEEKAQKSSREI